MAVKYIFQLIWFLWLIEPLSAALTFAKPGCRVTCGEVTIPYPFGIGAGCFFDEWFEILCHHDRPYLSKYYGQELGGEVLDVSLDGSTVTTNANNSQIRVCEDKAILRLASNLSGSPFFYDSFNKVIVAGCGNVMLYGDQTIIGGCASACDHDQYRRINGCYGINCCVINPRSTAQNYYLNFTNLVKRSNYCASVTLDGRDSTSFSDMSENLFGVPTPVVLRWLIPGSKLPQLQNSENCIRELDYDNVTRYYRCNCRGCTEGNPYIPNGCQDSSNCASSSSNSRKPLILRVVGGTSLGILFLVIACLLLYKTIIKRREKKTKEKYFKRNGGLLLQQQLLVDKNSVDKVRLFTATELEKATDYFNENRVLGHGGQGTVYKGMLIDGKIVAVKKSKLTDKNQVKQFINEVVIISQINHRNVVKLLGCCLETDVPLLIYEFIPNGTLYNLIHNKNDEFLMSWDMRLRIATEVAGALAYLHSATLIPIYHRDIKSSNVLLDEKYKAKVSDFGTSKHMTIDQSHLTTMVKGTFGYLDPEYFQSNKFTEKSDVYSFGVVLVELLTGQKPISSAPVEEESILGLASRFFIHMEEDRLDKILDSQVLDTASTQQVTTVARLAQRCLSLNGKKRPTMKEVAIELESIKMSHMPSTFQTKFHEENSTGVEHSVITSNGIFSWTSANDIVTPSSGAYPIVPVTF